MSDEDRKLLEQEINVLKSRLWNVSSWANQGEIRSCLTGLAALSEQAEYIHNLIAFKGWARERYIDPNKKAPSDELGANHDDKLTQVKQTNQ